MWKYRYSIENKQPGYMRLYHMHSQGSIEIPYTVFSCKQLVYGVITYAMIHFEWKAIKFFVVSPFHVPHFHVFHVLRHDGCRLKTPNEQLTAVTSSGFYSLWNLFSGFLILNAKMPKWWVGFYWICPVAWMLYG